jgi:hypothetical protein
MSASVHAGESQCLDIRHGQRTQSTIAFGRLFPGISTAITRVSAKIKAEFAPSACENEDSSHFYYDSCIKNSSNLPFGNQNFLQCTKWVRQHTEQG